ncbi:PAS-domain containing protein [Bradyrhizobium tropiciagri]|uniref:PAS-domain containing protein n=1 Tax=Bradyrhizobium tropiciagri TaxID=312253 RepID=UPI001BACE39F|nr:PAS-domain containing protein [Bradyrhizobium tropiciagri]MBR0875568.1 PAS-domain containing protein [Bradyrhizobium tropiciagri]
MRFDWRAIMGPALTAITALAAFLIDRLVVTVPNPAPLFVCIVALASSVSGITSGLVSSIIAVAASALFFLNHRAMPGYDASDVARMLLLAATAAGTALITGLLRQKWIDAFAADQEHHATAARLAAALDQVDIGIVLLDADTRAEFINRAFRDYFALSDAQAESKPPFIALMYHGRNVGVWELPEDELGAFIAERTEKMRAGDSTPINIKLADGEVLRFSCTALPDGGRMLSYTPVTDLVRHTDDPARADEYRAQRAGHGRLSARLLRAAE